MTEIYKGFEIFKDPVYFGQWGARKVGTYSMATTYYFQSQEAAKDWVDGEGQPEVKK